MSDPMGPAMGCLIGMLIGGALWFLIVMLGYWLV